MAAQVTLKSELLSVVSGQCGNANGVRKDDVTKEEDVVSIAENLFPDANPQLGSQPFAQTCKAHQKEKAMTCCKERHGTTSVAVLEACVTDNCCGGDGKCNPRQQCH